MKKIPSFEVNHLLLKEGIYISRKDYINENAVTTFDLRFTVPNNEPAMDTAAVHAIEHLAATYLRNDEEWKDRVIYFGPMGCRTGFYLILAGDLSPAEILPLIRKCVSFIISYEGEIPGATPKDCGNYLDMNLGFAKFYCRKFYGAVLENPTPDRLKYPE